MKVQRAILIDYDLEKFPLKIKTDSVLGSNDKMIVWFLNPNGDHAGGVQLTFSSPPEYLISDCSISRTNFPNTLPTATDKVWTITLTRTSGIRLQIHCNNVEMVDILMSDSTCSDSRWSTVWTRDVSMIVFSNADTASDYFRPHPGM